MSKTKSKTPVAAGAKKGKAATAADPLSAVKSGGVTKPSQTVKSKSKDLAKKVASKADEDKKSKKKAKKEVTPEPESDSDEEMESSSESESEKSESEESSESESEEVVKSAVKSGAANGTAKAAEESSDDSDSESESDDEAPKAAAVNGNNKSEIKDEDEDDDDEESSDESSDSEEDSDDSEESSEEESEEEAAPKKRKAEEAAEPETKKAKVDASVNGQGATANLFVGNLSWNVDEEWLGREFGAFGELAGVRIITDRDSGRSKGFGYVEFVNAEDAAKAHKTMKDSDLDGRTLNVDFAKPRDNTQQSGRERATSRAQSFGDQPSQESSTLWVGNLPFDATPDTVGEEFGKYGSIIGIRLPTDRETGEPKGFGYVEFSSVDEAKEAFNNLRGFEFNGRPLRLDYSTPRANNTDSPRGGRGGRGGGRGAFGGRGGGGRGGRGGGRGGRGGSTNRGGFGDFQGKKMTF